MPNPVPVVKFASVSRASRLSRRGFTLIEMMISMTMLLFIIGVATNFFRRQGTMITSQMGRLDAQQTAQFTLSELDRELRLAGVGVADMQPILVQADPMAMTFNADLVSRVAGDPSAVYIDPDASPVYSAVFRSTDKAPLPLSSTLYPDSTYMRSAGAPSGAETIAYWLSPDSSSSAANEYVLWRRVNAGPPRLVAKGVVKNPGDTVFQYFKFDSTGALSAVPETKLPAFHSAVTHGAPTDTGRFALVDSINTVRVRLTVAFHGRDGVVLRRLDSTIRLMNAGLIRRTTCGNPPIGVQPATMASLDSIGQPLVTITWPASADETAGEKDVERYALFRRPGGAVAALDEPFASIPAGSASYSFTDTNVRTGESWQYGVAVQDCTPTLSSVTTAAAVTIP